jgi:hypothetical protein
MKAKIISKDLEKVEVVIDDAGALYRYYFSNVRSLHDLKNRVLDKIKEINDFKAESFTEGEIDLTPDPVVLPAEPTQDEIDRKQFNIDYRLLWSLNELVKVGVFTGYFLLGIKGI